MFNDNGGEFANEQFIQLCQQFNIEPLTTAAYAPWSNRVCERHNLTLTEMVKKIKEDNQCDYEVALSWALMAKNMLSNVHGYSAYQLVFGKNPNLPSALTDKLPALSGTTTSKMVGEHISALYRARKAFTETECSERLRRALRKQTRTSREEIYKNGDKVFFKRPSEEEWRGPARVIGQDGVVVFVRHGSQLVRVHVCRLKKVQEAEKEEAKQAIKKQTTQKTEEKEEIQQKGSDSEEEDFKQEEDTNREERRSTEETTENTEETENTETSLKRGQRIRFTEQEGENKTEAVVLGRAGKATGRYKNWFNIGIRKESGEYEEKAVNIRDFQNLEVIQEEGQENEEIFVIAGDEFKEAKEKELGSWKENQVYVEVEDEGQECISTRWVCEWREREGKMVPKARLVLRGFEEEDKDREKASPTCTSEGLKMVLTIMAQNKWKPRTMDIKTAFLQGDKLERDIYIKPPIKDKEKRILWKIEKCVYGLKDASLYWYNRVKDYMRKIGGKVSKMDPAIFFWEDESRKIQGILACHVDDFLYSGSEKFKEKEDCLRKEFTVGKEKEGSFKYVGIKIQQKDHKILMDQNDYAKGLSLITMTKDREKDKQGPVTEEERKEMRAKIGQLLWLGRQTRPDLLFDASALSTRTNKAVVQDLIDTNKAMKKAVSEKVTLTFQKLENLEMRVYSDSSLGNLPDDGTQGGYFICLQGKGNYITPLAWSSKKLKRVVRSSLAGETLAMADAMDNGIFLASLFSEISSGEVQPEILRISLITDNQSLLDNLTTNKAVTEKRLRVEIAAIKEAKERKEVKDVIWVSTENQLADVLTKKGVSPIRLLAALEEGRHM